MLYVVSGVLLLGAGAGLLLIRGSVQGMSLPAAPGLVQWGPDIQVSHPSTGGLTIRTNPALAINPLDPNQVLAAYDALDDYAYSTLSGYSWSTDAGRTWQGGVLQGSWYTTTTMVPYGAATVGFDREGTAYYVGMALDYQVSGYYVLTATAGAPWSTPVPILISDYNEYRDRAVLAADLRAGGPDAGALYLAWRYYNLQVTGLVELYTSRDSGRTWSGPTLISDPGRQDCEGITLVVGAEGTLYTAFAQDPYNAVRLYLDRSTDGGRTWGTDQLITGAPITKIGTLDWKQHSYVLVGNANDDAFLINSVPAIAASPTDSDTVYVVWNDGRWDQPYYYAGNPGRHGDIAFSHSTDGGMTWSLPRRLNDDLIYNGVDQFQPTIAVGPQGQLGVTWYDRRDDPQHYLYHLYYSESTDGGITWSANVRVSDQPSDPMAVANGKGEGFVGQHGALVFGPTYVLPGWMSSRGGLGQGRDIVTDRGLLLTATPSPTPGPTRTPPPNCTAGFSDVPPTHPFHFYIGWIACQGIVSGYSCGSPGEPCDPGRRPYFRPAGNVTRGQTTKMIVLGLGWAIPAPPTPTFADVPATHPFYPFIETAFAHGTINGYSCGGPGEPCDPANRPYFRSGNDVTRGQLTKIIVGAKGWGVYAPPTPTFADVPATHPFFGFIERAAQQGVVSGYACGGPGEPCDPTNRPAFRAGNAATRGQVSKILYQALTQP